MGRIVGGVKALTDDGKESGLLRNDSQALPLAGDEEIVDESVEEMVNCTPEQSA